MARKGFKWKTMINTDSGVRYQIMQMNKTDDIKVSDTALNQRKLKARQEPVMMKAAQVWSLAASVSTQNQIKEVEVPYCGVACVQAVKASKGISKIADHNPGNHIAA